MHLDYIGEPEHPYSHGMKHLAMAIGLTTHLIGTAQPVKPVEPEQPAGGAGPDRTARRWLARLRGRTTVMTAAKNGRSTGS
jgi:hypothetical protein